MELSGTPLIASIAAVAVVFAVVFLVVKLGKGRHEMSRAGLAKRAVEEAESLRTLAEEREESRPEGDSILKEHDLPHRRVTLHDEGTREIYVREHLPEVAELRRQLRGHGVRDQTFDALYESVDNGSDLLTVSTALSEMAHRLTAHRLGHRPGG